MNQQNHSINQTYCNSAIKRLIRQKIDSKMRLQKPTKNHSTEGDIFPWTFTMEIYFILDGHLNNAAHYREAKGVILAESTLKHNFL